MKLVTSLREYLSVVGLQKLQNANISFPTAEKILPYYITCLTGFVIATTVGFFSALSLLPKGPMLGKELDSDFPDAMLTLPDKPRESDFSWVIKRNIFDSSGVSEDSQKSACDLVKSQLPLKFTGVIFGGTSEASLVLLESAATRQADTYMLNEVVQGDARIVGIEKNRVIFERNNCQEYLDLEEPPAPKRRMAGAKPARSSGLSSGNSGSAYREDGFERDGTSIKTTRQWVEKAITVDFTKTLQDVKASPNTVNGEVKGFVLTRIRPDSVYEKLGLVDGDVVEAINGIELNDAARAIQTLNNLKNEPNIELQIKRKGAAQTLRVQVQ